MAFNAINLDRVGIPSIYDRYKYTTDDTLAETITTNYFDLSLFNRCNKTNPIVEINAKDGNTICMIDDVTGEVGFLPDGGLSGAGVDELVGKVNYLHGVLDSQYVPSALTFPAIFSAIISTKYGDLFSCNLSLSDFADFQNDFSEQVLYADVENGDNSNDGLTWSTAKKSIGACVDLAISSELDTEIMVAAGVYYRQVSPSNGSSLDKVLTSNVSIKAVNGRVETGPFETLTYSKTVGKNYVYETARSAAQRVLAPTIRVDGKLAEYKRVASIDLCDAEAGTWYTDDVTVYIHSHNDAPVTDANARVYLSTKSFVVDGAFKLHMYGLDISGGSSGAFGYTDTTVLAQDCSFNYALVGKATTTQTAIDGVVGYGGTFIGFNCESSYNSKDGFNFHENSGGDAPVSLTVNCTGFENGGTLSGISSCNGLTSHDGGKAIDIGGVYSGSYGANVAIVSSDTEMWCYGTVASASGGDKVSISTGGFSAGTDSTCKLYLENTKDEGCNIGLNSGAGQIFIRNHKGTGSRSGTITEFTR